MNYIKIAVPFFILLIAIEFVYGWLRKRNTYRVNDTIGSL
ncbi:MAG: sterol desaturase family protein, partial [Gammaproteobacteria bacterium]|nr:sterol desaturase family protein [Gammaproteobacteria bacterium]